MLRPALLALCAMGATIIILAAAIGIQIAEQRQEEATMRELEANPVRQQPAERRLDEAPMWELETELERQQQAELEALVQLIEEVSNARASVESVCLLGDAEAHRILVAEGVSDNLQHSLFLLDEWCFTRHAPIP